MAKEINLLDLQIPVKRAVEHQLTLPNLLERESEPVRSAERGQKNQVKKVIEALLFASNEPLSFQRLREIIETKLPLKPKLLRDALEDLREDYIDQQRAFLLEENSLGFILKTREEYSGYVEQLFRNKRGGKLSQAAIEVMAIIAYKQPITKPQIDAIRGVDCSGTMQNLLERELVQHVGKLDAPGRPTLFGTTTHFLSHFGLKSLDELPGITAN